jgi:processive 1,2-diacylglycerol beta-glucosyltransferase
MIDSRTAKKVLVVYASFGAGHRVVAENIVAWLKRTSPQAQVELLDVLSHEDGLLSYFMQRVHYVLYHHVPGLWGAVYGASWARWFVKRFRYVAARFNHKKVFTVCEALQPDIIISTQTTATGVVAYLKREGLSDAKLIVALTDFGFQSLWLYDEVNEYWTVTPEQVATICEHTSNSVVKHVGVILPPINSVDVVAVRQRLDVPVHARVVLWSSGSLGVGWSVAEWRSIIEQAVQQNSEVYHIIVCGHNKVLRETLTVLQFPRVVILGYHTPMSELYAIADTFVTKAGGVSVAEALQYGLRIVLSYAFPGQEQDNYNYLTRHGLAIGVVGQSPAAVATLVVKPPLDAQRPQLAQSALNQEALFADLLA